MEQMPFDSTSSCEMEQKQIYTMKNDFATSFYENNDCKLCQTKHPDTKTNLTRSHATVCCETKNSSSGNLI